MRDIVTRGMKELARFNDPIGLTQKKGWQESLNFFNSLFS